MHKKSTGTVMTELPSMQTFDRAELPVGVNPKDVAAVITLREEPIQTFVSGSSSTVVFDKAPAPVVLTKKSARRIVIMKSGEVVAGPVAAEQIVSAETVAPSRMWMIYVGAFIIIIGLVGWGMRQFEPVAKVFTVIIGIFKRK
jgi:hypothetical protein